MNVVGYVRVSTEDQAENGVSLAAQRRQIEAYCQGKGWTVEIVQDDASGKSLDRPGFQAALALKQPIVAVRMDRITRNLADWVALLEQKIEIVLIHEQLDLTSAIGRAMANIRVAFAQMERELIIERTKAAMEQLRIEGKRRSRFAPFGYRFTPTGELEADPNQQIIIREIYSLREKGWNYRDIGQRLAVHLSTISHVLKRRQG